MPLQDVQATKRQLVAEILTNPTYTPESGVYCRLYNRLMTLAKDDLASLAMLISLKVRGAAEGEIAWTDDGLYHAPRSFHPHICAGCTSDAARWGQPVRRK